MTMLTKAQIEAMLAETTPGPRGLANTALIAAAPDLARTAIALHDRVAELEGALRCFLADDRFQVAVGGNPNVVEAMISAARATLERTTP